MRNLINFILRYSAWFLFLFYVVISSILLFQNNPYQQHIYLSSANRISSVVYEGMSNITSYFYLRDINEDLQMRNAMLETELLNLKNIVKDSALKNSSDIDSTETSTGFHNYTFTLARVINNSIAKPYNYITINKGSEDGIEPEMGIVDQNGVVGIVNVVGKHSARILSLLNPNFRLSCKVKNTDYFGSLVWDGKSPYHAILEEMPRHVKFNKGDTIITSGFSSVFPEGIIVGIISEGQKDTNNSSYSLKINLTTDFTQLSTVRVIKSESRQEIITLEKEGERK